MADNKAGDVPADGLSRDRRAQLSTGYATRRLGAALGLVGLVLLVNGLVACAAEPEPSPAAHVSSGYPWHTDIVATTFWVGEVFDANASDGSQVDLDLRQQVVGTLRRLRRRRRGRRVPYRRARSADNGYFPRQMTPRENPFYLDLPFDDINNSTAFAQRGSVVPWAHEPGLSSRAGDRSVSFMKNRWVKLKRGDRICYGQIQDAGPGVYDDAAYVFGSDDRRPAEQPVQRRRDGRLPGTEQLPRVRGPERRRRPGGLAVRRRRRRAGGPVADPRDDGRGDAVNGLRNVLRRLPPMRGRRVAVAVLISLVLGAAAGLVLWNSARTPAPGTTVVSLTFDGSTADQRQAVQILDRHGLQGTSSRTRATSTRPAT